MNAPVLILGATGSVGRGLVAAAVAAGRAVIAVARDKPGLQQLQADFPAADITALPGSVASDAQGARLAKAVQRLGRPLSGVMVAVCGGGGRGRLLDQPANALRDSLRDDLLPHLVAARHLLPLLAASQRGGYVLIGGPGRRTALGRLWLPFDQRGRVADARARAARRSARACGARAVAAGRRAGTQRCQHRSCLPAMAERVRRRRACIGPRRSRRYARTRPRHRPLLGVF